MEKHYLFLTGGLLLSLGIFVSLNQQTEADEAIPSDHGWAQRAFPFQTIPTEAYYAAVARASADQAQARGGVSLDWTLAGPTNIGGRITDLAMHATDLQTIYAATASGGVWKSTDAGDHWQPITDALPSLSIGDIALDPSDKNTLYCGTGEPNGGGGSITYDGRGVYKSSDGGATWQSLGLEATGSIGRIEVDPQRPNRVFVAAMGHLFGNNPERGLYRSTDGGQHWEQKLFLNDSVGVIDVAINPEHPDTVYAVTWERIRRPSKRVYGGPGSAIWRSTDGGEQWQKLTTGLPGGAQTGRIGIALAPSNPAVLYATFAQKNGAFAGVYTSVNHGDSWSLVPQNADPGYYSFGWWFGQIRVDPNNPDHIFNLGVNWLESPDAGASWFDASGYLHADYHALYVHPANSDFRVVGNDGGIYLSNDGGGEWQFRPLPITQFNTGEINFQQPSRFSGGAQDNGTPSSLGGGLDDWTSILGGDGFVTLVNPVDTSIYYAESQYGGFKGSNDASAPLAARYNWNTPYILDPNNPDILYFGAEKLFKSTDRGITWTAISQDLSNGPGGAADVVYGTITSVAASALDENVLLAGTDDGNVWATANGGNNWSKVSADLPKRWVTRVVADARDAQTAFVCLSGYRHHETMSHVYKTTDLGQTWTDAGGDLPDIPVNDLILDPLDANVWYVATDAGVFSTADGGQHWTAANNGLPTVPVTDLTFHAPTRTLLAATYGRSMYRATVPPPSGVTEAPGVDQVVLVPNPCGNECRVSLHVFDRQDIQCVLYDLAGKRVREVFSGELPAGKQAIALRLDGLSAGVYVVKMGRPGAPGVCRKLVKTQ